jgi:hypothetical protein
VSGRRVGVCAAPPFVSPETRRPAGVARLHSRRGGTNKSWLNGANYNYRGWAKSDVRIPTMPITHSDLMAITIPSDADHRRSEATLGISYHAEVIGIRQPFCD